MSKLRNISIIFFLAFLINSASTASIFINEFMADNDGTIPDEANEYDDWIELYNSSEQSVDLSGMYMTDDLNEPDKWQIPSGVFISGNGYLIIWADEDTGQGNTHADFKLRKDGEEIGIFDSNEDEIDSVVFGSQNTDESYGRYPDGGDDWWIFYEATPGEQNTGPVSNSPQFSHYCGLFNSSFQLTLTSETQNTTIRYTLDDSEPNLSSAIYTNPITISSATLIRAKAYDPNKLPSPTVSNAYIKLDVNDANIADFNSNLPIVVIDSFGVDINSACSPSQPRPYRTVYTVFVDTNSTGRATITDVADFAGRGGMHVRGQSTACDDKKSYALESWDENNEDVSVQILGFPEESDWILYSAYGDKTLLRNVLTYEWSNAIGRYAARTKFVEVFFNQDGDDAITYDKHYVGVYVFMEKLKRDKNRIDITKLEPNDINEPEISGGYFIKDILQDIEEEKIQEPENPTEKQIDWITNHYNEFVDIVENPNSTSDFSQYVYVDSMMDYSLIIELTRNLDHNINMYKDRSDKINLGPVWDYDGALSGYCYNSNNWWCDPNGRCNLGSYDCDEDICDGYYPRLSQDSEYRLLYADRWFELREDVFSTSALLADIDTYVALLDEAKDRNFTKWPDIPGGTYQQEIDYMKDWLEARVLWLDENFDANKPPLFSDDGGYVSSGYSLTITDPQGTGVIYYTTDGNDPRDANSSSEYTGPITLNESTTVRARVLYTSEWSAINNASFAVGPIVDNLRITEVMFHPDVNENYEFVELKNIGTESINLKSACFADGIDFTFPSISLGAGEILVVVKNEAAFIEKYGSNITIAGEYLGKLSNGGERIHLVDSIGTTVLDFEYSDSWYPTTDGDGYSLTLIDPTSDDLSSWSEMESWRPSIYIGGSPGIDEVGPACWYSPTQCHGDSDGDGYVGTADYGALSDALYTNYGCPDYNACVDFDRDGDVDNNDFAILQDNWFEYPDTNCSGGGVWPPESDCLWYGRVFDLSDYNESDIVVTQDMINKWIYLDKPDCWCCVAQKVGNSTYEGASTDRVDTQDFNALQSSWYKSYTDPNYYPCSDSDLSGLVGTYDFIMLQTHWYEQVGSCLDE